MTVLLNMKYSLMASIKCPLSYIVFLFLPFYWNTYAVSKNSVDVYALFLNKWPLFIQLALFLNKWPLIIQLVLFLNKWPLFIQLVLFLNKWLLFIQLVLQCDLICHFIFIFRHG